MVKIIQKFSFQRDLLHITPGYYGGEGRRGGNQRNTFQVTRRLSILFLVKSYIYPAHLLLPVACSLGKRSEHRLLNENFQKNQNFIHSVL